MIPRDEAEALAVCVVWTLVVTVPLVLIATRTARLIDRMRGRYQH